MEETSKIEDMEETLKTEEDQSLLEGQKEVRVKRKQRQKIKKKTMMAQEAASKLLEEACDDVASEVVNQGKHKNKACCKDGAALGLLKQPLEKAPVGALLPTPKKSKMKSLDPILQPMKVGLTARLASEQSVTEEAKGLTREVLLRHRLGNTFAKLRLPSNASDLSLSTYDGFGGAQSDVSTSHSHGQNTPPMTVSPPPGLLPPPGLELSLGGLPKKVELSPASLSHGGSTGLPEEDVEQYLTEVYLDWHCVDKVPWDPDRNRLEMHKQEQPKYVDIKECGGDTTSKMSFFPKVPIPKFCPYCGNRCDAAGVPSCPSCGTSLSWMMEA
jgi:hypothetical protein